MNLNTIGISGEDLMELGPASVDWKANPEQVLEAVSAQLHEHGLEIEVYDAGDDSVNWLVVKASPVNDRRDYRGERELGDINALRAKWVKLAKGVQGMGQEVDVLKLSPGELNADIEFLKGHQPKK